MDALWWGIVLVAIGVSTCSSTDNLWLTFIGGIGIGVGASMISWTVRRRPK